MRRRVIAIDAALVPGRSGGVEQATRRMVQALGQYASEHDYMVVTSPQAPDWLDDVLGPTQRARVPPASECQAQAAPAAPDGWRLSNLAPQPLREIARRVRMAVTPPWRFGVGSMVRPNGFIERLEPDLIYYPLSVQISETCPSVVTMHDLQHKHFPGNFNRVVKWRRDHVWSRSCAAAAAVVAVSESTKTDLVNYYAVSPAKIHVIRHGAELRQPTAAGAALNDFQLPTAFALYPAQTWPHKNHVGLFRALAHLRNTLGLRVPLVCVGKLTDRLPVLQQTIAAHRLEDQVRLLGYVAEDVLTMLYQRARLLVYPSFFEGAGLPLLEAFSANLPVACARTSSLVEYAGDAALLFDPASPASMSHAIAVAWTDDDARARLVARGRRRAEAFTWREAARQMAALFDATLQVPGVLT